MNRVIAFDLDGTLTESDRHLLAAYHATLDAMHRPQMSDEQLKQMIGGTADINRQIVLPGEPDEVYDEYRAICLENSIKYARERARAYPGIREALLRLLDEGYITVLCSNGHADYTAPVLAATGLSDCISRIQPPRPHTTKIDLLSDIIKEYDSAHSTVMVGDRCYDAQAALENNVPFIGCLYGMFPDEIREANAQAQISAASELISAVHRLLPAAG